MSPKGQKASGSIAGLSVAEKQIRSRLEESSLDPDPEQVVVVVDETGSGERQVCRASSGSAISSQ